MRQAEVTCRFVTPYSQSRPHATPKLEKEGDADYRERTWRNHLHVNADNIVVIPAMSLKNCLAEAAKYLSMKIDGKGKQTYTKHFESGIMLLEDIPLGLTPDQVEGEKLFLPSDGVRGSGKRVWKMYPYVPAGTEFSTTIHVLDETITEEPFYDHLVTAGQFIGLGRFRPRRNGIYGRFSVESVKWNQVQS